MKVAQGFYFVFPSYYRTLEQMQMFQAFATTVESCMQNCTFDTRAKITKEIRTVLAMPLDPRRENQQKLALAKLSHTLRQRVHSKTTLKIFCCFYHRVQDRGILSQISNMDLQFQVIWAVRAVRENQHKLALAKLNHTLQREHIQKLRGKYFDYYLAQCTIHNQGALCKSKVEICTMYYAIRQCGFYQLR